MMRTVVFFALLAFLAWQVYELYTRYKAEKGETIYVRLWAAVRFNATILFQHIVGLVTVLFGLSTQLLDFMNMPEVKAWLVSKFDADTVSLIGVLVIAATIFIRNWNFNIGEARAETIQAAYSTDTDSDRVT
jgi:hypothetical protein